MIVIFRCAHCSLYVYGPSISAAYSHSRFDFLFQNRQKRIGWFDRILIPQENLLPRKLEAKNAELPLPSLSLIELLSQYAIVACLYVSQRACVCCWLHSKSILSFGLQFRIFWLNISLLHHCHCKQLPSLTFFSLFYMALQLLWVWCRSLTVTQTKNQITSELFANERAMDRLWFGAAFWQFCLLSHAKRIE